MSNKFEQLLDLLVNEETEKAEALFHEIVVEKSRDIYEGLAETTEESKDEEKVEETSEEKVEETSEEKVEETSEEKVEETKDEEVDEGEEVEIEETSKDEEATNEEESIEEVGGDATDELIKDVSAEEEGEMDAMGDEEGEMGDEDKDAEGTEERVADLEDALDELKAEFEKMMGSADTDGDGDHDMDDHKEEESVEEPIADELQPMEAKHDMKKKEKMDEYKIQKSADNADHSDKGAKSPVKDAGTKMGQGSKNIAKGGEEKGRPAPTAQKMAGDFENTGGKDKSTSFKKQEKADTADKSDKSAKSPVNSAK